MMREDLPFASLLVFGNKELAHHAKNTVVRLKAHKNTGLLVYRLGNPAGKRALSGYNETVTRAFVLIGGFLCTALPLFCLLWTVLPPVRYGLWITGLIAGEWALWLGGLGMGGVILGAIAFRLYARGAGGTVVLLGLATIALSLVPYFQTLPVARAHGVSLSWSRYFSCLPGRETGTPDATEAFAKPNGIPLALDVYLPSLGEDDRKRPAVVVVHGGSWNAGDKRDFPQWNRWLAQNGYVVFDVQYRLAPPPTYKQATGDVKAAVLWVKRHSERFGVDANRIALLGRSAGGQLALLAAYAPRDTRLPPSVGDVNGDASVRAVVSLYGPADLVYGYAHPARFDIINGPGTLRRYLGGTPESVPDAYDLAAPISRVTPQTPPTLLFHGERDTIVGPVHARHLATRLNAANIPHQAVYFPYATHGYDYNFDGWASQVTQKVLLDFLKQHI